MYVKPGKAANDDQAGYILLISLLLLMLLTLTAVYAAYQSSIELRVANNNKLSKLAFWQARAGLETARIRLPAIGQSAPFSADWSSTLTGPGGFNYSVAIRHKTEADLGRDLDGNGSRGDIVFWGDADGDGKAEQNTSTARPIEVVISTGTSGTAKAVLVAEFARDFMPLDYAVFADKKVDINNTGIIARGNRSAGKNISPPYAADIASNGIVELANTANVYGNVSIGKNSAGTQGRLINNGATIHGVAPNYSGRIEPDPLGMFTGGTQLARDFVAFSTANDNHRAVITKVKKVNGQDTIVTVIGIDADRIDLGPGETLTLPAGNYHVGAMLLNDGSTINIDTASGPVNIYLTGELQADAGSSIKFLSAGDTADKFVLYSNSSEPIAIAGSGELNGSIYAPNAEIFLFHQGDFYGMVWGNTVEIRNTGDLVYDPRLKCSFVDESYSLFSCRERRD